MDEFTENHCAEEIPEEVASTRGAGWLAHPFGIAGLGLVLMVAACMAMPLSLEDGTTPLRLPGQIVFLFGLMLTLGGAVWWGRQASTEKEDETEEEPS